MLRRIFAWFVLAGFIFLITNILFIGWYREGFAYIYLVAAVSYFLYTVIRGRPAEISNNHGDQVGNDQKDGSNPND